MIIEEWDDIDHGKSEINITMRNAYKLLQRAAKYGLTTEVVVWALDNMKADPSISIEQALMYGLDEWDC